MRDQTRHFMIMILNPHTFTDKKTIELKLTKPTDSFAIGFRYSCEVCDEGTSAEQISVITNLSALPQDRGIKYSPIPKKKGGWRSFLTGLFHQGFSSMNAAINYPSSVGRSRRMGLKVGFIGSLVFAESWG